MMKKTNIGKCLLGLLLLPAVVACIQEDYPAANPNDCSKCQEVELVISSHQLASRAVTRAYSQRTDLSLIKTLDIVTMDAEGEVLNTYRVDDATTPVIEEEEGVTGLLTSELPVEGGAEDEDAIVYRLSAEDADGVAQVAVVANYIDASGELASLPEVSTLSELQQLKQGAMAADNEVCSMYGELSEITPGDANEIWLNRTLAMVTLQLKIDTEGDDRLKEGIIIKPTKVELFQVPSSCTLGDDNIATEDNVSVGQSLAIASNPLSVMDGYSQNAPQIEDAHYSEDAWTLFLFENKNGENSVSPDNDDKRPIEGKYCSYIQVTADYEYWPELNSGAGTAITGTVAYKFCLGNDAEKNFDVVRNTHYKLTLTLAGWGGLLQNGNVQNNGTLIVDANEEAYWRVDADVSKRGSGFTEPLIHVPVGGSHVVINMVGDVFEHLGPNAQIKYTIRGNQNVLWAYNTDENRWDNNPSSIKLDSHMVNNGDGTYFVHLYMMPWSYTNTDALSEGWGVRFDNSTSLEDWLDNSYRVVSFEFDHVNADQSKFEIYQYAPLPVLVDDGEVEISETNFHDAELFYMRMDIMDGELLRWGPEGYDNIDLSTTGNILVTDMDQLKITNPDNDAATEFEPAYGFHNQVAYFVTDRVKNYNFISYGEGYENGLPDSMLEYCMFTSANAEHPGGSETEETLVSTPAETDHMHHYALATVEEWEKIVKYGVKSPDWPILPVPYWTSSVPESDGTKSYVYNPGSGKYEARDRSELHLGRMVYHKNNIAEFGGNDTQQ